MKNKTYILAILAMFGTYFNTLAQDTTIIKKTGEKRIIIIHKSGDSIPDTKDTIEIGPDADLPSHDEHYISPVINTASWNIGFANVQRGTVPFGIGYSEFPELKNGKSVGIGFEQNWGFNLIQGKLRLWTGVRYDIHNYRFSNTDMRLVAGQNTFTTRIDSGSNTDKSKVVVNYLGVPIALGFQSNRNHIDQGFSIKAGVTAGYMVRGHTKVKSNAGKKEKEFDDFNFNDFALSPFVVIGYNSVALYGRYTTTGLFKSGQGPSANAYEFGLLFQ